MYSWLLKISQITKFSEEQVELQASSGLSFWSLKNWAMTASVLFFDDVTFILSFIKQAL